ncbi:MAG TPA: TMEM175 family protein [Sphingomicrobium sp.]|nr:TMEM175 family protein [Sphingomicrobium sp.]
MSEPESLATDESLEDHIRRHSYDRLIMLSDGIFAFATTLAAVSVRIPAHAPSFEGLLRGSARSLFAYVLSFAVAGIFWINSRNLFARLRRVDVPFTAMTLAMLCLIALIPATISTLYVQGGGEAGFHLYGLTMFLCGILNTAMWAYASRKPEMMFASISQRERWTKVALSAVLPVLFLPVLTMRSDQFGVVMLPIVIAVFVVRRVLLPRWLGKRI